MNTILCICLTAAVWRNAVSTKITNTWARYTLLDGFLASTGNATTARSIVQCGSFCNQLSVCQSYFFLAGEQESNCNLHNNIFLNTSEMIQMPDVTYYIPANYSLPSFECHLNDGLYHTVQLLDNTLFTYKFHEGYVSYSEAINICATENGNLVKITTSAKLDLLRSMLLCPDFPTNTVYFIGGMYDANADKWYFNDGSVTKYPNLFWAQFQPKNFNVNKCVVLGETASWFGRCEKCTVTSTFICEKN